MQFTCIVFLLAVILFPPQSSAADCLEIHDAPDGEIRLLAPESTFIKVTPGSATRTGQPQLSVMRYTVLGERDISSVPIRNGASVIRGFENGTNSQTEKFRIIANQQVVLYIRFSENTDKPGLAAIYNRRDRSIECIESPLITPDQSNTLLADAGIRTTAAARLNTNNDTAVLNKLGWN